MEGFERLPHLLGGLDDLLLGSEAVAYYPPPFVGRGATPNVVNYRCGGANKPVDLAAFRLPTLFSHLGLARL